MSTAGNALEVRGLSKRFGAVQALDQVDLTVRAGEVHALVGENGAGKSTLIHILSGNLRPDAGEIKLAGRQVRFRSAHAAAAAGLAAVFQELSLVGTLSVAENIFANRQPTNGLNFIQAAALRRQTLAILRLFDIDLNPDVLVERLSPAEQQVVEILKALSAQPCVLLLDEPTSSLTQRETAILFRLVRRLRQAGVAIVYISHHLREVLELADTVTVLRDGRHVATLPRAQVTEAGLVRLMVGRELQDIYGPAPTIARDGTPRLVVKALRRRGAFESVDLQLWPGEIVGLAGLVGAGRTALGLALVGAPPAERGQIHMYGHPIWPRSPAAAAQAGLAYVTEDRKTQGLFLRAGLCANVAAPRLAAFTNRLGFLRDAALAAYAERCRRRFGIVTPDVDRPLALLSGGNQQKALLASWIGTRPAVLIADEPTRGVDVGARRDIYGHLRTLAAAGAAVLLISSDLQEILGLSDRVLVMRAGRVVAEFDRAAATEEAVIAAALGAPLDNGEGCAAQTTGERSTP
jgi:ABC-type sugar transport system ATPase subunit